MKPFYAEVIEAMTEVLQPSTTPEWSDDTRLEADLGMDSGLMLELIMQLEETVPDLVIDQATLSYEQFATIESVRNFVTTNRKQDAMA
ncbi:MAG: phosphopantetheine-binding protein [Sulfitobacter sp.]